MNMKRQAQQELRENDKPQVELLLLGTLDRPGSSNSTSNKVNNTHTIQFPTLVSEIFLDKLMDVQLLGVCRLVCKSWNIAATKSLRRCSVVRLTENESYLADFTDVLLTRCFGPLERLPSPFRSFHVEGRTFTDPAFMKLALLPSIEITRLVLKLEKANQKLDQSKLAQILASQRTNITDLTIEFGNGHFDFDEAIWANDETTQLLSLKSLKLKDSCNQCTFIPFLKKLLGKCVPEKFDFTIGDEELLISLLSQDKVKNLKKLRLELDGKTTKFLTHLIQLHPFCLKSLEVYYLYFVNPDDIQQWTLFCKNVSPFLEDFATNIQLSTESELVFPNLKEICVDQDIELSGFTPDRFPSLSKVTYVFHSSILVTPENDAFPHEGVESLLVDIGDGAMTNDHSDEGLLFSLIHLSRQFPNVSSLDFIIGKFRDCTIADIYEAFPKLTAIELDGECSFFSFSGIRDNIITKYLELGRPVEKIPRRRCVTDFKELQYISFGPHFVVQPGMIIHCLPRIPKLRCVEFNWNESLSAPLLRDSLGHLEKIVILNSSDLEQAVKAEVSRMLPNA